MQTSNGFDETFAVNETFKVHKIKKFFQPETGGKKSNETFPEFKSEENFPVLLSENERNKVEALRRKSSRAKGTCLACLTSKEKRMRFSPRLFNTLK